MSGFGSITAVTISGAFIFGMVVVLLESLRYARTRRLHLMGLASQGGVHAQLTHLYAVLKLAKQEGVEEAQIVRE